MDRHLILSLARGGASVLTPKHFIARQYFISHGCKIKTRTLYGINQNLDLHHNHYLIIMPSQFTNNINFIPATPKRIAPRKPVLAPQQLPKFLPFKPTLYKGSPNLLPSINRSNPLDIFDLFISIDTINQLVAFTNRNTKLNLLVEGLKGHKQSWRPCIKNKIYRYIGVTLYFRLY